MSNMASGPPRQLDYLIILDLETTNDDRGDPQRIEIVEFPWLVYDLSEQCVRDHKQIFITPKWNPNPNPPPDVVRGLGPDVAFAQSLAEALHQFDTYIFQSFISVGKSFYLLTDGHWDLTSLLLVEAARKAVVLAPHFRSYINLRKEFAKCYPNAPQPKDRKTMFSCLDIPTERRANGIDDCLALASVVSKLLQDGHRFIQPEYISDYEWAAVPARIPAIATPVTTAVPVGGIVRLRGLPWSCTEQQIEQFLHGIPIVPSGIHFVRTSQGRATGEAFVQLESAEAVQAALGKDMQSLGRRYIEVFKSSPSDMASHLERADARRHMYSGNSHHSGKGKYSNQNYNQGSKNARQQGARVNKDNSLNSSHHQGGSMVSPALAPNSFVVKVTGLPRNAVADDLLPVVNGLETNGIHIVRSPNSSDCNGEAFIELRSEAWAKKAIARSGSSITCATGLPVESTYTGTVEIRKCSAAQMRLAFASQGSNLEGFSEQGSPGKFHDNSRERGRRNGNSTKGGNHASLESRYFIRVRNIDESVRTEHISNLFEKFQINDDDIKFVKYSSGNGNNNEYGSEKRSNVETIARIAFRSKDIRDSALSSMKRNATLGNSQVLLEDGGSDGRSIKSGSKGGSGSGAFDGIGNQSSRVVRMRGLPYTSTDDDIVQFFDGYTIAPGGISRGKDRHGRASGEAWVTFVSAEDAKQVIEKLDKAHMGTRYIELKF